MGNMGQTLILNQESWSIGEISSPALGRKSKPQFLHVSEQPRWAQTAGSKTQTQKHFGKVADRLCV